MADKTCTYTFRDGQREAFIGHLRIMADEIIGSIREHAGDPGRVAWEAGMLIQVEELIAKAEEADSVISLSRDDAADLAAFARHTEFSGSLFDDGERACLSRCARG